MNLKLLKSIYGQRTSSDTSSWMPVVKDPILHSRIHDKLNEIREALDENLKLQNVHSLFFGNFSVALFYTSWLNNVDDDIERLKLKSFIRQSVEEQIEKLNTSNDVNLSYVEGINGIAWAFEHLSQLSLIDAEIEECLEDFDEIILSNTLVNLDQGNLDLFYGVSGNLNYLIERFKRGKIDHQTIQNLFMHLYDFVFNSFNGHLVYYSNFEINLGYAHGYGAIIALLCKLATIDESFTSFSKKFFLELYRFIEKFEEPVSSSFSFPNIIKKGEVEKISPIRWCHGEFSLAINFAWGGEIFDLSEVKEKAKQIGLKLSKRRDLKSEGIHEFGFCHGSAGNAHLFARLYNYTKEEQFSEASEFWLNQALDMDSHVDGLAGYRVLNYRNEEVNSINLLNGISGLGLVLMAAISDSNPQWDKCLMLS